jgi:hypothetical protein
VSALRLRSGAAGLLRGRREDAANATVTAVGGAQDLAAAAEAAALAVCMSSSESRSCLPAKCGDPVTKIQKIHARVPAEVEKAVERELAAGEEATLI